ncbi:MAG: ABC transporter permease, partial [Gammaproteobacteria bacterium]|nr:ABC transporter permease [Gammaproteobacteria bacterium]
DGLQTLLGEGGAMLSGGEGQRLRLARALARREVRLAILDEPFRGLDREHRRTLLAAVREHWRAQTLLCATHDVAETQNFARVLVIEHGRIIEDGAPQILYARADSRYRALLEADDQVRQRTWQDAVWRRLSLVDGQLQTERYHAKRKVVGLK